MERVLRPARARLPGRMPCRCTTWTSSSAKRRVAEFARSESRTLNLHWWALGRIDTLMQLFGRDVAAMARSGLTMVFSGAESSSDAVLATMNKGGQVHRRGWRSIWPGACAATVSCPSIRSCSARLPIRSGTWRRPSSSSGTSRGVNPATEIVPIPTRRCRWTARSVAQASKLGLRFPTTLEEWASDKWRQLMMRRGDGIPWLDQTVRTRVRNFERVLNAFYPTVTDRRLTPARRALLKTISAWRYALRCIPAPYELRALHRLMQYQRPGDNRILEIKN